MRTTRWRKQRWVWGILYIGVRKVWAPSDLPMGETKRETTKAVWGLRMIEQDMRHQRLPYGAVYGGGHINGRLLASLHLVRLRYSYESLLRPGLLGKAWGEMFYVHQGHLEEGLRRVLHVGEKEIGREFLKELAWTPGPPGEPARSYPDTFNMMAKTGFQQARFLRRFDKTVEAGMIKDPLADGLSSLADGGGEVTIRNCRTDKSFARTNSIQITPMEGPISPSELREKGGPCFG